MWHYLIDLVFRYNRDYNKTLWFTFEIAFNVDLVTI